MQTQKKEILEQLRRDILCLQGLHVPTLERARMDIGPLQNAFPDRTFSLGAVHELLSNSLEDAAATSGFITALLTCMRPHKPILWISTHRTVFPPALKQLGLSPEQVVFIDVTKEKDALWTVEEALKCDALAAVIGEIRDLDFTQSRRLQLAVENSRVTGFIHRLYPRQIRPTACVSRWRIRSMVSRLPNDIPGVGFPRWQVELLKVRNGMPGTWQLEWNDNKLSAFDDKLHKVIVTSLKKGIA